VGSFSSDRDIKKTIALLQNNGFDGFVKEIKKGDSMITEVYVGPTKQRSAAEKLYDKLKQAHILGSVVPTEYNEQV
jgi:cell division septation protein DedD